MLILFSAIGLHGSALRLRRLAATDVAQAAECWSERRDLNSGPPVPQTGALTGLRYAPTDADIIILSGVSRNKFKIARISRLYLTAVPLNSCTREREGRLMFTIIACFAVVAIAVWTDRQSDKEMVGRPSVFDDDLVRQSIVFARRDLRLIAWVLAAILIVLGIIADRIH